MQRIFQQLCLPLTLLVGLLTDIEASSAAIMFNGDYSQNFDTLSTTSGDWKDDTTIPGWFSNQTTIKASNGGATGFISFGATNDKERALGSSPNSTSGTIRYGAQFQNKTDDVIKKLKITYFGEQWSDSSKVKQSLTFQLGAKATTLGSSGYETIKELNFESISNSLLGNLDGNNDTYRKSLDFTIKGIKIDKDAIFWIRWEDLGNQGLEHGLAIDDISVKAVAAPEPLTILGAGTAVGFGAFFKRKIAKKQQKKS